MKKEKEEMECEMRKLMSVEMVRSDLQNELDEVVRGLLSAYGLRSQQYDNELRMRISAEEKDMVQLKEASIAAREEEQNRVDAAHMECTKLTCETGSLSSAIEQTILQIEVEERKLQDAASSNTELDELASKIENVESLLSSLPKVDEEQSETLRLQRQNITREIESLRKQRSDAEKLEEVKHRITRKKNEKEEIELQLKGLLEKHTAAFISIFEEVPMGPWSNTVNTKVRIAEESNSAAEIQLKNCERDLDRAAQGLSQSKKEEQRLLREVEQLKENISTLCGCPPHDVADNLSETRHLLSKSRKELASISTKALLYESWSEETTKRSCCPLCERRFSNKSAAAELSGKLLDMSLSLPQDIERLERCVHEAEEKERRFASALIHVEQCKRIMEEKVKVVRKQMSDYLKEEATLSQEVEHLKDIHAKEVSSFKVLLNIKADVSLMDSLFSSARALDIELNELTVCLDTLNHILPLSELTEYIENKEGQLATINAEIDHIQSGCTERNKLMAELNTFKERRMSLEKFTGQTAHIQEIITTYRTKLAELKKRHQEIVEQELPLARNKLIQAKNARDIAERFAKEQEEIKLSEIREMRSRLNAYVNLVDKIGKLRLTSGGQTVDTLTRRIAERNASIIELERRKTGFEIGINDLEGNHSKRRILEDQLTRMLVESKIHSIERELAEMTLNQNDREAYQRQRENAIKERDDCNLEKARLIGQLEEVEKKIAEASSALSSKEMKQAESLYHEVIIDKIIAQEMITDLEKYMQCLDTSIIQFHTDKMIAINRILDDLWRKVYDGNDIQSINIKSECAATSEKRKVYDYRVVMVLRNGVELDMRDRCSAGQKMLACILIRLALADVFGGMCSIMALDEPTTNLDALKVDHIAAMLNSLIAIRRRGYTTAGGRRKQFQMIVITHDEQLVDKLMIGSRPDFIYVLGKDPTGISHIRRQYSDGRSEATNGMMLDM